MAKELMEIGGFITEGAEIVNHDNTLSGNGTVDSPLGIVPGYNETVLFQNGTVATKSATLSEPITNFNKIGVLVGDDHYGHRYIETYTSYPFAKWIANYGFDAFNTGSNSIGFRELAWSANGNKIYSVVGWQKSTVLTATGGWNAGQSGTYGGIIKVVGINRINNA